MNKSMLKNKAPNIRTYDENGFRYRASAICLDSEDKSKVLLISTLRNKECWVLAGGGIEPGETPEETVLREVLEEGGIKGTIEKFVGCFRDEKLMYATYLYVLLVQSLVDGPEWQERERRTRRWFSLDEAYRELQYKDWQADFLKKALQALES